MQYAADVKTSRMTAVRDQIDAGSGAGKLEIGTAGMAAILVTFPLNDPSGTVSGDVLTLSGFPKTVSATGTGVAAAARIRDSDDSDVITGLTVGLSGADINVDNTSINTGQNVTINASPTITHAAQLIEGAAVMPIISSLIVSAQPQLNGTLLVHEQHTDHNGIKHDHIYNAAAGSDIELAMSLRAQNMGAEIDKREAAALEAENFVLPLSKYDFLNLFTQAERMAIRTAGKTDVVIEDFLAMLDNALGVYLTNPDVISGVNYFVGEEILTQERASEILGNG